MFSEAAAQLLAAVVRLGGVADEGQRVHQLAIEQQIDLDNVRLLITGLLVLERGVPRRDGLDLGGRKRKEKRKKKEREGGGAGGRGHERYQQSGCDPLKHGQLVLITIMAG
jgi:hypothetical protein